MCKTLSLHFCLHTCHLLWVILIELQCLMKSRFESKHEPISCKFEWFRKWFVDLLQVISFDISIELVRIIGKSQQHSIHSNIDSLLTPVVSDLYMDFRIVHRQQFPRRYQLNSKVDWYWFELKCLFDTLFNKNFICGVGFLLTSLTNHVPFDRQHYFISLFGIVSCHVDDNWS